MTIEQAKELLNKIQQKTASEEEQKKKQEAFRIIRAHINKSLSQPG